MLYCPKCQRTYDDGTQRFCDHDGGRLLPAPNSAERGNNATPGTFTSLLGRVTPGEAESRERKPTPQPRFVPLNKSEQPDTKLTSFPSAGRIFQSENVLRPDEEKRPAAAVTTPLADEEDDILELDVENFTFDVEPATPKPEPRLVRPEEIASGTGTTGDRSSHPLGREALTRRNPRVLIGQVVKGRYLVTSELAPDDEDSMLFLGTDQLTPGKKVVVRIFMADDQLSQEESRIIAEERIALAHLKHPNVAGVFDSGRLPEGREFIVSEFVEGQTLGEMLKLGQFNALRTARVIRQASYALSEAHQNGVLHRSLKPENIALTVSDAGIEQVKLMNFGVSFGEINSGNLAYKSPEEIERGDSTYASDIYSLAVVAYQLLTARLPFDAADDRELLRAQQSQAATLLTQWRPDVQPLADQIIAKALSFNPAERYPKARDFGDALFNALTTISPFSALNKPVPKPAEPTPTPEPEVTPKKRDYVVIPAINAPDISVDEPETAELTPLPLVAPAEVAPLTTDAPIPADIHITPPESENETEAETSEVRGADAPLWEKRSPEPPKTGTSWRGWAAIAAVVALLLVFWAVAKMYVTRQSNDPAANVAGTLPTTPGGTTTAPDPMPVVDGDVPPGARSYKAPEGFAVFQNRREELTGDLATKQFLGFGAAYPANWTKSPQTSNFLDVGRKTPENVPLEQMIVTRYDSRGTMTLDRATLPKLAEKSNRELKEKNPTFKVVEQREATIQNGRWKVWEVQFEADVPDGKGGSAKLYGRRFWMPVQTAGAQNGFVITLLASSLTPGIEKPSDVGVKGELADVLESFEPEIRN